MQEITEKKLNKQQAQDLDTKIVAVNDNWFRSVAPLMHEMKDGRGYEALGYKTFREYCSSVDERLGYTKAVSRLIDRIEVEANVGVQLPARHAYVLADLPSADAQREVFAQVMDEFEKPVERNFLTIVARWLKKHTKKARSAVSENDGWTKDDLEADGEVATALDRIEKVYGHQDRKALQDGTIGLSRKDIIGLSRFHQTKMKEVQYLIMVNHWDLATAMKFTNKTPDAKTTVHELQNHALTAAGFSYVCQVEGFDIRITACKAFATKIKG